MLTRHYMLFLFLSIRFFVNMIEKKKNRFGFSIEEKRHA